MLVRAKTRAARGIRDASNQDPRNHKAKRQSQTMIIRSEAPAGSHDLDNVTYNLAVIVALLAAGSVLLFRVKVGAPNSKKRQRPSVTLRGWGVPLKRIKSALRELERKTFHLCGLLVPLVHLALLETGFRQRTCIEIAWAITVVGWSADLARLHVPVVARHWPLRSLLRDHEREGLTGGCYFSLGCTLAMTVSPPDVSSCAIIFLVLGDMAAALIGVSFGNEIASLKLGREGKKSVEGSLAMFVVCFLVTLVFFWDVQLAEYVAVVAAATATLTELYEPLLLDDNLTIPFFSALALQVALYRVRCPPCANVREARCYVF